MDMEKETLMVVACVAVDTKAQLPEHASDHRYVQMYLHVWTGLQQVGHNILYVVMTDDILRIHSSLRNMARRRSQVRFCNALPLSICSSAEGQALLQSPHIGLSHF